MVGSWNMSLERGTMFRNAYRGGWGAGSKSGYQDDHRVGCRSGWQLSVGRWRRVRKEILVWGKKEEV